MSKRFYTDIDLRFNELIKSCFENIDSTSAGSETPTAGRVFYATDWSSPAFSDGTSVHRILWNGGAINPRYITQIGFDSTEAVKLVTQNQINLFEQIAAASSNYELITRKNQNSGYAGLDSTGKLALSTLWGGMVVLAQDGTTYRTLGQMLDQPYGVPSLNAAGQLAATRLAQDNTSYLLVSQQEKDIWNGVVPGGAFEIVVKKGAANGYAPLDSGTVIPEKYMPEGVVYRNVEHTRYEFSNGLLIGDYFVVTWDGTSQIISVTDATAVTSTYVALIKTNLINRAGFSTRAYTVTTASSIDIYAFAAGDVIPANIQYVSAGGGTSTCNKFTLLPAFYDITNIGGIPTKGFAPLNAAGVVEDTYLPNYKDITIVADIAERNALSPNTVSLTKGNGQMTFVIDATADPTVDSGWAQYIWKQSTEEWIKMAERESSVDISHNVLYDMQGDGVIFSPKEVNHLTNAQLQSVRDIEPSISLIGVNANFVNPNGFLITSFDNALYRSSDLSISYEDPTNKIVVYTEMKTLFDGRTVLFNESARLESGNSTIFPEFFALWDDINNLTKIYVASGGPSVNISARMRKLDLFSNFLIDVAATTPTATLTPSSVLVPHTP